LKQLNQVGRTAEQILNREPPEHETQALINTPRSTIKAANEFVYWGPKFQMRRTETSAVIFFTAYVTELHVKDIAVGASSADTDAEPRYLIMPGTHNA
jgi:hypothetical protein